MKEISRLIFQWNSYETIGLFHEKQDIPSKASILTIFVKFRFDGGIYIPLSDRFFTKHPGNRCYTGGTKIYDNLVM